jgi:phosphoribosylanthranilate isomerase
VVEVKFCGLTREDDVQAAVALGAGFVGAVMTESRRRVTADRAKELFSVLAGTPVKSVGVFGDEPIDEMIAAARTAGCDIVQMHGSSVDARGVNRLREELGAEVWEVVRVAPDGLTGAPLRASTDADGILVDTLARGALGGSGTPFDWREAATAIRDLRLGRTLIVAGGLRPDNVAFAIERLAPDVVDVSSGVESAPGLKDHQQMAAFMAAVRPVTSAPSP